MRKLIVFAAAGTGLFIAGCTSDVMSDRRYIPIAQNDPVVIAEKDDVRTPVIPAETEVKKSAFKYEPMTDVVSTGGVDSAPKKIKCTRNTASAKGGVYIVKSGDTPERIARRHGVKLSAFMAANNLDQASARKLQIGQKLVIPGKDGAVAVKNTPKSVKKSSSAADSAPAPVLESGKYTVKSGDTPERIARRYKIKLSDLLKANNLDDASARKLQIGQKLVIPGKEAAPVAPEVEVPQSSSAVSTEVVSDAPAAAETAPAAAPAAGEVISSEVVSDTVAVPVTAAENDGSANIETFDVPADMTAAEVAALKKVPEAEVKKLNNNVEFFAKGSLILLPKK